VVIARDTLVLRLTRASGLLRVDTANGFPRAWDDCVRPGRHRDGAGVDQENGGQFLASMDAALLGPYGSEGQVLNLAGHPRP
jgi:hypothetical protein